MLIIREKENFYEDYGSDVVKLLKAYNYCTGSHLFVQVVQGNQKITGMGTINSLKKNEATFIVGAFSKSYAIAIKGNSLALIKDGHIQYTKIKKVFMEGSQIIKVECDRNIVFSVGWVKKS